MELGDIHVFSLRNERQTQMHAVKANVRVLNVLIGRAPRQEMFSSWFFFHSQTSLAESLMHLAFFDATIARKTAYIFSTLPLLYTNVL
jgi:hypothetical protein